MNQVTHIEATDPAWNSLYKVGGVAALLAGVIFRRIIGAEVSLFSQHAQPDSVIGWFTLLQNDRFVGLSYLNFFDIIDYALLGIMFLALYVALRRTHKSYLAIATILGLIGITVYFASNTALSMLSLSNQFMIATTAAQKAMLLAAGQAMLAISNHSGAIDQSTGTYMSFLFVALAGLIISIVMLWSTIFSRVIAYVGILAGVLDLAYCLALVFVPAREAPLLAVITLPAAGLLI